MAQRKVYIVMRHFSMEYCGDIRTIIAVCEDETDAELRALGLNEQNTEPHTYHYADVWDVKTPGEP